jgi:myosin-5
MNDGETFLHTCTALNTMGISGEQQSFLWDATSAILHLGNLEFNKTDDGEGCTIRDYFADSYGHCSDAVAKFRDSVPLKPTGSSLEWACHLLGLPVADAARVLTQRKIELPAGAGVNSEVFFKPLTALQGLGCRDALAKFVYAALFEWLVAAINRSIRVTKSTSVAGTISILDIFGFESFESNSFEQLCINYANEALQQQFNSFVFKSEQRTYIAEGIEWEFISFPDNHEILDLIHDRACGILAHLDDECQLPGASDARFAGKLYAALAGGGLDSGGSSNDRQHAHFAASAKERSENAFSIRHYAGRLPKQIPNHLPLFSPYFAHLILLLFPSRHHFINTIQH